MGTTERRARAKAALRQQILDAARELFIDEGYEAVSMRKIAQRIEYSPTAIYLHFEDKQALFRAVCDETFERLARRLDRLTKRETDPLTRLRDGLHAYVDFALKHPQHYTATFLLKGLGDAAQFGASAGGRAFGYLHRAVEEAMTSGALRRGDVATASQSLWAACHGVAMLLITLDKTAFPFVARATLVSRTIDTMLRGLRP
jgi:AcrR family transcriptional regulator